MPGDLFTNSLATALSEIFGILQGSFFVKMFGLKGGFVVSFLVSFTGGVLIVMFGDQYPSMMPVFCVIARIGISALFTLLYILNAELFPTMFAATAMGICNFMARLATIMAPMLAEVKSTLPMVIYSVLCLGGIIFTMGIKAK